VTLPNANQTNAAMMRLGSLYGQSKIKPVIDRTMPMAELKAPAYPAG
jgi:NADPH:quinone reductase-like Zn-dependent oxidoreductase